MRNQMLKWVGGLHTLEGHYNVKMVSYQYRKSHCGDKTIIRSSYLHYGVSYHALIRQYLYVETSLWLLQLAFNCQVSKCFFFSYSFCSMFPELSCGRRLETSSIRIMLLICQREWVLSNYLGHTVISLIITHDFLIWVYCIMIRNTDTAKVTGPWLFNNRLPGQVKLWFIIMFDIYQQNQAWIHPWSSKSPKVVAMSVK